MIVYSISMFVIAVVFLILGILVYKGNTGLIHSYHRTKIKESDKKEYGKAFAKGLFAITLTLAISGIVALFGEGNKIAGISIAILFVGIIVSFVILGKVQKKYNGGLF